MRRCERGSVLLITALVVVLVYGLMTLSLANSRRTLASTKFARARLQADYLAKAGLSWGMEKLRHESDWAAAHTAPAGLGPADVPAVADRLTVDPQAPEVRVWVQETSVADRFELRSSCRAGGQLASSTALFQRVPAVDGRVYAAVSDPAGVPALFELAANRWENLPTPPYVYWRTAAAPATRAGQLCENPRVLQGDTQGNLYLLTRPNEAPADALDRSQMLVFDRSASAWKLLPPVPPQAFDENGAPVAGYDQREVTALASDGETLYAVAVHESLPEHISMIGAPEGGAPPVNTIDSSTLYRLRQPLEAAWSYHPTSGWQAGSGATWEVLGPVPAPFGRCLRATLASADELFLCDALTSSYLQGIEGIGNHLLAYQPSRQAWTRYPTPPATLYVRDAQNRLSLTEVVDVITDGVVSSDDLLSRYEGVADLDPQGNLYYYLDPHFLTSTAGQLLPTLYRFEPSSASPVAGKRSGTWKQMAIPAEWGFDDRGQLVQTELALWDMTLSPDGNLFLAYQSGGSRVPVVYQYSTGSRTEQPGRPRIPPLPGVQVTYDASAPGLCRFSPTGRFADSLMAVGSGGVRRPDVFDFRPTAIYSY